MRTKTVNRKRDRAGAATAIGLIILGPSALAIDAGPALARLAPQAYEIAPGPMADALSRLADESGAHLVFDAAIARHVLTRGVHGKRTLEEALDELLMGTNLGYRVDPEGRAVMTSSRRTARGISDAMAVGEASAADRCGGGEDPGTAHRPARRQWRGASQRPDRLPRSQFGVGDQDGHADPRDARFDSGGALSDPSRSKELQGAGRARRMSAACSRAARSAAIASATSFAAFAAALISIATD